MVVSMHLSTAVVPRRLRRRLLDNAWAKWLVPLGRCIALPVADNRNRFLVPLCVLILVFLPRAIGPVLIIASHCGVAVQVKNLSAAE